MVSIFLPSLAGGGGRETAHKERIGAESKRLCRMEKWPEIRTNLVGKGNLLGGLLPGKASSQPPCLQICPSNPSYKGSRLPFLINPPT